MHTRELAIEGFTRVGLEVRDNCGARSLRGEATTSARGPFAGVVGFVHADVICSAEENKMNECQGPAPGGTRETMSPVHLRGGGV
jgi:hypothetical protein